MFVCTALPVNKTCCASSLHSEYYEEEEIPDPFSGDYYETVDNRAASPGLTPRRNELLFTAVVVSALRVQTRVLP